jgi:hypothetical protein
MSTDPAARATFARIARAAIERAVAEARTPAARWDFKPNVAWVRWPLADGWHAAIGLRRHLDWVTGELGLIREEGALDALPLLAEPRFDSEEVQREGGGRVRLGAMLHEDDRWWPAGDSATELGETLGQIALQLRVKAERLLHPHAAPGV